MVSCEKSSSTVQIGRNQLISPISSGFYQVAEFKNHKKKCVASVANDGNADDNDDDDA